MVIALKMASDGPGLEGIKTNTNFDQEPSNSDTEDEIAATSPLKETLKEVGNVITCLYRLSISIQNPASRDRLERIEKIDMTHFEPFDIEHVRNKYDGLGEDYRLLIERLGKANTKRRQLLKYHHEHHEKIIGRRVAETDTSLNENDYLSEAPSEMRTTVSTAREGNVNLEYIAADVMNLENRSEAGFSQTSYASPTAQSGSLRVPAPPLGFHKGPFQCPYCFSIIVTDNRASCPMNIKPA